MLVKSEKVYCWRCHVILADQTPDGDAMAFYGQNKHRYTVFSATVSIRCGNCSEVVLFRFDTKRTM